MREILPFIRSLFVIYVAVEFYSLKYVLNPSYDSVVLWWGVMIVLPRVVYVANAHCAILWVVLVISDASWRY